MKGGDRKRARERKNEYEKKYEYKNDFFEIDTKNKQKEKCCGTKRKRAITIPRPYINL